MAQHGTTSSDPAEAILAAIGRLGQATPRDIAAEAGVAYSTTTRNLRELAAAGRAQKLISLLQTAGLQAAGAEFYNSLEAPALEKYPLLALFQEYLRANGAAATLMSGSGSTTFALVQSLATGQALGEKFKSRFGQANWIAVVPAR